MFPFAGITRIRFNGYDLRLCATPAKYAYALLVYRRRDQNCQRLPPDRRRKVNGTATGSGSYQPPLCIDL